jgi:hypothetical protein
MNHSILLKGHDPRGGAEVFSVIASRRRSNPEKLTRSVIPVKTGIQKNHIKILDCFGLKKGLAMTMMPQRQDPEATLKLVFRDPTMQKLAKDTKLKL